MLLFQECVSQHSCATSRTCATCVAVAVTAPFSCQNLDCHTSECDLRIPARRSCHLGSAARIDLMYHACRRGVGDSQHPFVNLTITKKSKNRLSSTFRGKVSRPPQLLEIDKSTPAPVLAILPILFRIGFAQMHHHQPCPNPQATTTSILWKSHDMWGTAQR